MSKFNLYRFEFSSVWNIRKDCVGVVLFSTNCQSTCSRTAITGYLPGSSLMLPHNFCDFQPLEQIRQPGEVIDSRRIQLIADCRKSHVVTN